MRTVTRERVVWRRLSTPRHYVGELYAADGQVRLTGRDPVTGIEVSLSIPFAEIERVCLSRSPYEDLAGERCAVLQLAGSDPVCLREAGREAVLPTRLVRRLAALVSSARRGEPLAAHG